MPEVKITFIQDYQPKAAGSELFRKGQSITVSDRSAAHFMSRGVAVGGREAKAEAKKTADAKAAEEAEAQAAAEAKAAADAKAAEEAEAAGKGKRTN